MNRAPRTQGSEPAGAWRAPRWGVLFARAILATAAFVAGGPAGARADDPPPAAGADTAGAGTAAAETPEKASGITVGGVAPEFALQDLDGKTVKLADALKKGPVLLDFWALWCKPCLEGLPGTDKLLETYGPSGFSVFAVNTDSPRTSAKVKAYVKSKGFEFDVLLDPNGTMQRLYRFYRIPQTYLIASDGTIVHSQLGYSPGSEERLAGEIEKLVGPAAGKAGSESGGD